MKSIPFRRALACAAVLLTLSALTLSAAAVTYMPGVSAETASADYWIAQEQSPDTVLMTPEEIAALNTAFMDSEGTKMRNVYTLPDTMDTKTLINELCGFTIAKTYYINGKAAKPSYFEAVRANMKDPAASAQKPLRYGLVCSNTNLKGYPIAAIATDSPSNPEYDAFQFNKLLTGDGVVILAESKDKAWYYVYTRSFNGWVKSADVAVCASKQEWMDYLTGGDFLVVTGSKVVLEQSAVDSASSLKLLTIGTRLPLSPNPVRLQNQRTAFGNHMVLLPTRGTYGGCVLKEVPVPVNRDVQVGYLPYTQRNLLTQLFQEQGDRYGWGGMLNADDCTSYLVNVYRCFGIWLPNGGLMQAAPELVVTNLKGYSDAQKMKLISQLPAGTILQFPGHVVCYLGEKDGELFVTSAMGSARLADGQYTRVRTVAVSTLSTKGSAGNTWLSQIYFGLTVRLPHLPDLSGLTEAETEAVLALARRNVVDGLSGAAFSPKSSLTGADAVTLLSRAFRLEESWLTSADGGGLP